MSLVPIAILRLGKIYPNLDALKMKDSTSKQTALGVSQANPEMICRDLLEFLYQRRAIQRVAA